MYKRQTRHRTPIYLLDVVVISILVISKEAHGNSTGHRDRSDAILGHSIIKISQTGSYLANEAKFCNKSEFNNSL